MSELSHLACAGSWMRLRPGPNAPCWRARSAKLCSIPGEDESATAESDAIPGIDRFLALTDGVVAIALTLLVLQLQVPVTSMLEHDKGSASALWHALDVDGPELISHLVAFLIIAQFWLGHHRVPRAMRGHHEGLAWPNFGFLLALTLMPFTSDLLGRYGDNPVAITLFGLNPAALSLRTQWICALPPTTTRGGTPSDRPTRN